MLLRASTHISRHACGVTHSPWVLERVEGHCMHVHMQNVANARMHVCPIVCVRTHVCCMGACACVHACMRACVHACMQAQAVEHYLCVAPGGQQMR